MLCSVCHKNMAVIFTKKIDGNKTSTEGLCMDCARAKGINPIDILVKQANLSEDEIKDLTSQFEGVFNEIQEGMEKVNRQRTTFIIANRLSSVKSADQIFILSKESLVFYYLMCISREF